MVFKRALYPRDWPAIRKRVLERARGRCERCGARNYAAGYRDADGRFHPTAGNQWHDAAGNGELPYREAREGVRLLNETGAGLGPGGEKGIVIVLTVAHLNHDPADARLSVLRALCQACHLRYDLAMHVRVRKWRARQRRDRIQPPLPLESEP